MLVETKENLIWFIMLISSWILTNVFLSYSYLLLIRNMHYRMWERLSSQIDLFIIFTCIIIVGVVGFYQLMLICPMHKFQMKLYSIFESIILPQWCFMCDNYIEKRINYPDTMIFLIVEKTPLRYYTQTL